MQDLIEGTYATGDGAFHPGSGMAGLGPTDSEDESDPAVIDPSLISDPVSHIRSLELAISQ